MFGRNRREPAQDVEDSSSDVEELSDEALLKAIASKSIWAIEALYARYHRFMYALAYRMTSDRQIAEDLLQDAFLAVWRSASSYVPKQGSVRTWLFSIIHHRTIDYLRGLQRRPPLNKISLEDAEQTELLSQPDAWDDVWRAAQGSHVREALHKLPTEQRVVVELAYFQGRTHTEIASICEIPLGTVKARMRLALRHLQHLLKQAGIDGI